MSFFDEKYIVCTYSKKTGSISFVVDNHGSPIPFSLVNDIQISFNDISIFKRRQAADAVDYIYLKQAGNGDAYKIDVTGLDKYCAFNKAIDTMRSKRGINKVI